MSVLISLELELTHEFVAEMLSEMLSEISAVFLARAYFIGILGARRSNISSVCVLRSLMLNSQESLKSFIKLPVGMSVLDDIFSHLEGATSVVIIATTTLG